VSEHAERRHGDEGTPPASPAVAWQVRRIVVALDASPASAAAARNAARLAARLAAQLHGLFVEDVGVLRLAALPLCIEVGTWSATPRRLTAAEVERRLRAQAARARRMLEESALAAAVDDYRFEVLRGEVGRAVAGALADSDLLSLGRVGTTGLARLGSVARAAMTGGRGQILLLPAEGRLEAPVVTVFGDAPGARLALAAALRLLDREPPGAPRAGALTVLLVAADDDAARRLEDEARATIAAAGHSPALPRFRRTRPGDRHALAHTVALDRANALLLPAESPLVRPEDLEAVVEALDCSVLLVR
jgi:nucleotide-binding universal stress UspA family protein